MKIEKMSLNRRKAHKLWKEYVAASKKDSKDKTLKDMKAAYNQLKSGRKLIDIQKVFEKSGIRGKKEPRLAIALATSRTVFCTYSETTLKFQMKHFEHYNTKKEDIVIRNMPSLPSEFVTDKFYNERRMTALVPVIPVSIRPDKLDDSYYILWEVEKWKLVPPNDPYLLRRITNNIFVVVGAWNLTELEKSVMRGRI